VDRFGALRHRAKSESDFSADGAFLRLRALLTDRFALKMHRETREESVYLLTVAKGGLKMDRAEGTCIPPDPQNPPQLRPGERSPDYCGKYEENHNEFLAAIDAHFRPGTGALARLIFTVTTLCHEPFKSLLLHRTNQIRQACLKDRRITNRVRERRQDVLFQSARAV
jgi:uncharacterized protein (TIGR03435 family)